MISSGENYRQQLVGGVAMSGEGKIETISFKLLKLNYHQSWLGLYYLSAKLTPIGNLSIASELLSQI